MKILLQVLFWNIVLGAIFSFVGYEQMGIKFFINKLFPYNYVGNSGSFISSYLFFFLSIPFLNMMLKEMDIRIHKYFLCGALVMYTVLPTVGYKTAFSCIIWFSIVYMLGAYIRIYDPLNKGTRFWCFSTLFLLLISWLSIPLMLKVGDVLGKFAPYYLVSDENKILALLLAVSAFMFFRSLDIKNNYYVNLVSASTFGVLLIHANSKAMMIWLWRDTVDCVGHFNNANAMIYAVFLFYVYMFCALL